MILAFGIHYESASTWSISVGEDEPKEAVMAAMLAHAGGSPVDQIFLIQNGEDSPEVFDIID